MIKEWKIEERQKIICTMSASVLLLVIVCVCGSLSEQAARATDFSRKDLEPSLTFLLGTDWLGRDMFFRTLYGLFSCIQTGIFAAAGSAVLALIFGMASALLGKTADKMVSFCMDLIMGIPTMLLLILISVALGRGLRGVTIGIALTHWPILAKVIRAEVIQIKEGKYTWAHLLPQCIAGVIQLFPPAILRGASITFLGFGLSTDQASIGIIISEAMKYLTTGKWWLAVLPGLLLLFMVVLIHHVGDGARRLANLYGVQK